MKNTNKNNNIQSDTLSVNINNSNDFNKVLHEIKKKETQNDKRNNSSKRNVKPQIKTKKDNDTRNVTKEYEKNNIKNVRSLSNNKNNTTYLKKQNIEDDEDEKNIKFYDTPIFPYITSLILDYENDNKKPEPVSNVIESKEQIKRYNSHNKIERKNTIYDIYEKTLKKLSIQEENVVEKNEEHLYNSKSLEHKKSTTSEGSKIKSSVINTNISNNSFDESSSNDISVIQQKNHETKKDTKKPKQYHINDDTLRNDSNNSNYDHNNTCESINSSNEYNNNYKNKVHIYENQKEKGENEKETQNMKQQQYNNNVIKTNEKNHEVTNAFDDYYIDEEHFRQRSITIMQDKKKKKKNDRSYSLDSKSIISDELKEKNNEKEDLKKKEIKNNEEKLNTNKNESNQNSSHENIYYQKKTSQNENINHSLNDQTYKIKKKKSYDKQYTQKLYTRSDITTTDSDSSINEKLNISYEIFKSKNENKMFSIDQEKKNKDSLLKVVNSKNILNIRKILRIMRELYIGFIGLQLIYFITYILFGNNNVYLIQIISMSCTLFSLLDANYHGYLLNGFIDICIAIFLNIAILQNISGFKTLQSNDVLKNITISNIVLLYFFSAFSFLNSYFIYKLHSLEKKSINYVIRNIESKTEKNIKKSVSTK
ncbi:hypothetical protein PFMALIP_01384 [Plasmodium falciparum MaliPS096_E11]|uniref:Basal complex transmembrane protein 1 n=1 Tax=Plasmodium falciparum MaliPS096_E11 TaxID=1036727 RepID=A0A024WVY1_PLAFA|nr:hypothetical protein PFMALIP_01384 [Plasmodium falciparum MaliPS096_E11]